MTLLSKGNVLSGFLAIAWSCAPDAWAWGGQGHRTIGAIADRLLSAQARAAVVQLLSGDVDKFGRLSGRSTLEAVSEWPDEIAGTPAAHPRWHYDDVPICGSVRKGRYCPDGQCNSEQLKRLIIVLADTRAASRDRNAALKWVVHLVGDLHQPLHAADNGDRGGNRVPVALAGVRTRGRESLHRAWDHDLVRVALHAPEPQQPPADIEALALEARSLVEHTGPGSPDSWALESNNLARNVAYHYRAFACDTVPPDIVVLDQDYQRRAEATVRERVLLAGARLAAVLNRILVAGESAGQRSL